MFHNLNLMGVGVTAFASAFALSGGLVALTIRVCRKRGWVAKPRSDRWHRTVPSLFGGLPIWFTFVGLSVYFPSAIRPRRVEGDRRFHADVPAGLR